MSGTCRAAGGVVELGTTKLKEDEGKESDPGVGDTTEVEARLAWPDRREGHR